jgi:hypothetical protein
MGVRIMLAMAVCGLLLAGCKEKAVETSDYWVAGLRLPEGSTQLSMAITTVPNADQKKGGIKAIQTIVFKNKAGWDSVAGELDRSLYRTGFRSIDQGRQVTDEMPKPGEEPPPFEATQDRYKYGRAGGVYTVSFQNERAISMRASDTDHYTIMIMQYKQ